MEDFEIIELAPSISEVNQREARSNEASHQEEEEVPVSSVARRRWQSAIQQQLVLLRMDKQNQWIKG